MQKFILGKTPANFKREVIIDLHDGSQATLEMVFKYRTRSEYAKFIDEIIASAKATQPNDNPLVEDVTTPDADPAVESKKITMQEIFNRQDDVAVDAVLKIAEGWDLADKFGKPALRDMQDRYPNAFVAINNAYYASIVEGRLKN